jgi:hypothetical protein
MRQKIASWNLWNLKSTVHDFLIIFSTGNKSVSDFYETFRNRSSIDFKSVTERISDLINSVINGSHFKCHKSRTFCQFASQPLHLEQFRALFAKSRKNSVENRFSKIRKWWKNIPEVDIGTNFFHSKIIRIQPVFKEIFNGLIQISLMSTVELKISKNCK